MRQRDTYSDASPARSRSDRGTPTRPPDSARRPPGRTTRLLVKWTGRVGERRKNSRGT